MVIALAVSFVFLSNFVTISDSEFLFAAYASPKRMLVRVIIMIYAVLMTVGLLLLTPVRGGVLSKIGKNTFTIFLCHRFITLIISDFMIGLQPLEQIFAATIETCVIVLVFGNHLFSGILNSIINRISDCTYNLCNGICEKYHSK